MPCFTNKKNVDGNLFCRNVLISSKARVYSGTLLANRTADLPGRLILLCRTDMLCHYENCGFGCSLHPRKSSTPGWVGDLARGVLPIGVPKDNRIGSLQISLIGSDREGPPICRLPSEADKGSGDGRIQLRGSDGFSPSSLLDRNDHKQTLTTRTTAMYVPNIINIDPFCMEIEFQHFINVSGNCEFFRLRVTRVPACLRRIRKRNITYRTFKILSRHTCMSHHDIRDTLIIHALTGCELQEGF